MDISLNRTPGLDAAWPPRPVPTDACRGPYMAVPFRHADALAVHLERLPVDSMLDIDGFRVSRNELYGIVCNALVTLSGGQAGA